MTQLRYVVKMHLWTSGFRRSLRSSSSVYVSIGALSAFGSGMSNCGIYFCLIKKRMIVFKSRA